MFKATSRSRAGSSPSGLVDHVDRSTGSKAKQVLIIVSVLVGLPAMVVATDDWHPIVAFLIGAAIGLLAGLAAALWVLIWPFVRRIWWWAAEITLTLLLFTGWTLLAEHTSMLVTGLVVTVVVGVPAAITRIRHGIWRLVWCFVTRHRIRHCFTTFILTNRYDSDPFILWARPIQAGERVWIYLRPGLAVDNLQNQVKQLAVGCWSDEVTVERASDTNSAYLRIDVKRRDPLKKSIPTPLMDGITTTVPHTPRTAVEAPTKKLDLTDVTITDVTPVEPDESQTKPAKKKPTNGTGPAKGTTNGTVTGPGGEDVSDYID